MTDHDNTDHTLTFDIFGNIAVSGSLIPGLSYVIYASMTNYKGEQERSRAQKIVTISQDASQNIGNILLYPTGIYFTDISNRLFQQKKMPKLLFING